MEVSMKFIKKKAQCVAIQYHNQDKFYDYRCPTCGMGVANDYICCPYCSQKLYFVRPDTEMEKEFSVSLKIETEKYK